MVLASLIEIDIDKERKALAIRSEANNTFTDARPPTVVRRRGATNPSTDGLYQMISFSLIDIYRGKRRLRYQYNKPPLAA
jgi:hypothetical protein